MADTYGGLAIPLAAPLAGDTVTDRALSIYARYFQAVLNARAPIAWQAVHPTVTGTMTPLANPVVRTILTHDPREVSFDEKELPALYLDRTGGERPEWKAEDYRVAPDTWRLLWVFPAAVQAAQRLRNSITNGIVKAIDRAVERVRDPAFVDPNDPDPTAATIPAAPTAIKTAAASSTSAQSYTGAALNGTVGSNAFAPGLLPTVTVGGDPTGITPGSTVTFTGLGADGSPRTSVVTLSAATGTYYGDWLLTQATQIDTSPQASGAATLAFGLDGFAGLGTNAIVLAGVLEIEMKAWKDFPLVVPMADGNKPRTYAALEITFDVFERLVEDTSLLSDSTGTAQFTYSDGTGVLATQALP
jgi:hypothetical protein